MVKYNYTGAAALWTRFFYTVSDPWDLDNTEKQKARRDFMRALTRRDGLKMYIDIIYDRIDDARPLETAKSRVYDFNYEKELENLIYSLKTFEGVKK